MIANYFNILMHLFIEIKTTLVKHKDLVKSGVDSRDEREPQILVFLDEFRSKDGNTRDFYMMPGFMRLFYNYSQWITYYFYGLRN